MNALTTSTWPTDDTPEKGRAGHMSLSGPPTTKTSTVPALFESPQPELRSFSQGGACTGVGKHDDLALQKEGSR